MHFVIAEIVLFFRKWTWTAIAYLTSTRMRFSSIANQWWRAELQFSTALPGESKRPFVYCVTNIYLAFLPNEERRAIDEICIPERASSVKDGSSLMFTTSNFQDLCSVFQYIANINSELICWKLLKFFFKNGSILINVVDQLRNSGEIVKFWKILESTIVNKIRITKQSFPSKSGLMFELHLKDSCLVIKEQVCRTKLDEMYLKSGEGTAQSYAMNFHVGLHEL